MNWLNCTRASWIPFPAHCIRKLGRNNLYPVEHVQDTDGSHVRRSRKCWSSWMIPYSPVCSNPHTSYSARLINIPLNPLPPMSTTRCSCLLNWWTTDTQLVPHHRILNGAKLSFPQHPWQTTGRQVAAGSSYDSLPTLTQHHLDFRSVAFQNA